VLSDLVDQVSQEQMDEKFEEALVDLTKSVEQYEAAGGPKPQEGFNQLNDKLENQFGANVKQIQEMLTKLN
jgi:hypothetical protein